MATVLTVSLQIDNLQNSLGFQLRIIVSLLTTYKMLLKKHLSETCIDIILKKQMTKIMETKTFFQERTFMFQT
jgi:hypothetical protein